MPKKKPSYVGLELSYPAKKNQKAVKIGPLKAVQNTWGSYLVLHWPEGMKAELEKKFGLEEESADVAFLNIETDEEGGQYVYYKGKRYSDIHVQSFDAEFHE